MSKFLCLGGPLHYRFVDHFGTILRLDNNIKYVWTQGAYVLEGYEPTICDLQAATLLGIAFGDLRLCVGGELHGKWCLGVPLGYKSVINSFGQHIGCIVKGTDLCDIEDWEIYLRLMERSI